MCFTLTAPNATLIISTYKNEVEVIRIMCSIHSVNIVIAYTHTSNAML